MHRYFNPRNYAKYAFSLANRHLIGHAEPFLAPNPDQPLRHPPVFIVGPPRSGSTLAMQIISEVLDVGYMCNRHCQWFGAPAIAEQLFRPTTNRPNSDYQSEQGSTSGSYAPAECGEWWYRFFRRDPPYVTLEEVDPLLMRRFRSSIALMTDAFDRPIVFKNLYASLRIQAIARYVPESLFIVIHRNEADNGHSLLEARFQRFKDYDHWFSLEPPEVERLRSLPGYKQVIEQIRHMHRIISTDMLASGINQKQRFDLTYENLCAYPDKAIDELRYFFTKNNTPVKERAPPPAPFLPRQGIRIDRSIYDAMLAYLAIGSE